MAGSRCVGVVARAGCGAGAGGGDDDVAGARGCVPGEVEPVRKAQGSEGEPTGIVGRDGAPVGRDGALVGRDVALFGVPALVVGRAEGPGLDVDVCEVAPLAELFGGVVSPAGGGVDGRAEGPVLDVGVFEVSACRNRRAGAPISPISARASASVRICRVLDRPEG